LFNQDIDMIEEYTYETVIQRLQQDLVTFSDRLGIMYDERPTIIFSRKEMIDILVEELPHDKRLGAREHFLRKLIGHDGQCFPQGKRKIVFVHVNPSYLRDYSHYKDTLAHELVHYRFWTWPHNTKFYETVNQLLHTDRRWHRIRLYLDNLL
jgi:WLM domain